MVFGRRSRDDESGRGRAAGAPVDPLTALVLAVAADAGFDDARFDAGGGRLHLADGREVDLSVPVGRVAGKTEPQQRAILQGAIRRWAEAAAPAIDLPPAYERLDDATRQRMLARLAEERRFPDAPRPQELLGRLERQHAIDGWRARLGSAAAGYERMARAGGGTPAAFELVLAANMHRLAGDADRAGLLAGEALASSPMPTDRSDGAALDARCAALLIGGRRAELASLVDLGQPALGPRWWPVCVAARAAEHRDVDALRREVDAAARLAADEDVDTSGMQPADRDVAEILAAWLRDLG